MNTAKLTTVAEKAHYPFKSYPRVQCETILFPGCAFPSQFPRTMDALSELCRKAGFGVAYDCCGDPLGGYGEKESCERVLRNVDRRLAKLGCKRLVVICPTCYKHLSGKLGSEVVTIYDVAEEIGLVKADAIAPGRMYIPCPDKKYRAMETKMREAADMSAVDTMQVFTCCGLRADLASRGPEYVKKLSNIIIDDAAGGLLYTYCASCLGQFSRMGYDDCRHVVSAMLGVDESPDSGRAIINRAKRKFDRNTNPIPVSRG